MNDKMLVHNTETLKHVNEVRSNIWKLIEELCKRAAVHDASKFESPEKEILADNIDALGRTEYGSPEYQELLRKVKPALDHHYSVNTHHPEHWPRGINDMDLCDVLEMLGDWLAATKRNKNGNIHTSIIKNTERFKMSPQLAEILKNTVDRYF